MERQLSQRTVEQIDRQLEFMQMEQHDIMNGRVQNGPDDYSGVPGLKDFDGFEELNAGGGEVVLEEVVVHSEPAGVPIEEDPNALGFKSEALVQYYELMPSELESSDLSLKTEGHSEESDPEYVPAGAPKTSRKRKSRTGTSDGPGRPSKAIKSQYTPKYKTEQSKPGPKAKVPDSELSPEELARRKQRRARNREAANRQRDKRVALVNDLESQVHSLQEENSSLKKENSSMKNELEMLRKQIQQANTPQMNQQPIQIMNGQPTIYTQGSNINGMNGQPFVLQMVPSQPGQGQTNQGQPTQFLTKTLESPSSARSTPNSVSTNGMNSLDQTGVNQSQVQIGNQVYTGPLPSPFTQVLLMSPSMPIGTQFQFPVTSGATVEPPKVQPAAFQKTVGSL